MAVSLLLVKPEIVVYWHRIQSLVMSAKIQSTTVQDLLFFRSNFYTAPLATVLAFPHRSMLYTGPKVCLLATVLAFPHRSMFYTGLRGLPPFHRCQVAPCRQISSKQAEARSEKKVLFFMISGNQRKTLENLLSCLPVQSNNVVDKQH